MELYFFDFKMSSIIKFTGKKRTYDINVYVDFVSGTISKTSQNNNNVVFSN